MRSNAMFPRFDPSTTHARGLPGDQTKKENHSHSTLPSRIRNVAEKEHSIRSQPVVPYVVPTFRWTRESRHCPLVFVVCRCSIDASSPSESGPSRLPRSVHGLLSCGTDPRWFGARTSNPWGLSGPEVQFLLTRGRIFNTQGRAKWLRRSAQLKSDLR